MGLTALHQVAIEAYNKQDWKQVIKLYTNIIEQHPKDTCAFNNRGNAYVNLEQFNQAIQDFDQAIALDPKNTKVFSIRGIAHAKLGQFDQAMQDFDQAIALNPKYAEAFYNRGNAYVNLEQFNQAIQDFDQAIALNPKDSEAFYNRGSVYADLRQLDQAIQDFDQAIGLNPKYSEAFHNRGNAYANLKQFYRAIRDFNQAIALNPKYANAFYNRGLSYRQLKKEDKAIADFKKAESIDPTVITQKQIKKVEENFEKGFKKTQESNKKVQDFQEVLKELEGECQKEESEWLKRSKWAVGIALILMLVLFAFGSLKSGNTYTIYIFSSIVTFTIIRQYTNAKSMRIEARNRLVMAKMFERVKQENIDYKKDFLPKLADAIVYSTTKEKNNIDGLVEKIIDRIDRLAKLKKS